MTDLPQPTRSSAAPPHEDASSHGGHGHDHDHDHPPFLAHHWDTPEQQFEAGKLGMWLFLATEVLLFGGLFCGYSIWRANNPDLFRFGSEYLDTTLGATNTAVLILSSLTMAWGVTAAQKNQQGLLKLMLILTLCGAATFMVIKYFEYTHKFHEGIYPGVKFYETPDPHHAHTWKAESGLYTATNPQELADPAERIDAAPPAGFPVDREAPAATVAPAAQGPAGVVEEALDEPARAEQEAEEPAEEHGEHDDAHAAGPSHHLQRDDLPRNAHMFFNIYFMMTGLHGIHVIIGGIVIVWLLIGAMKGKFNSEYFTPVDLGGLYWHVVDLIWIFLFPLFYLI